MAWLDPDWPGRWFQFAIALRSSDRLIGDIGLFTPADDPAGARIGYTLSPDFQGRGFAREAVMALIAYLIEARGKRRIVAATLPGNAPSQRLLIALGFRRAASLDLDGEWGYALERPLSAPLLSSSPPRKRGPTTPLGTLDRDGSPFSRG
jgi:RimJ/RimL family protein N-acetyltransferase